MKPPADNTDIAALLEGIVFSLLDANLPEADRRSEANRREYARLFGVIVHATLELGPSTALDATDVVDVLLDAICFTEATTRLPDDKPLRPLAEVVARYVTEQTHFYQQELAKGTFKDFILAFLARESGQAPKAPDEPNIIN